MIGDHHFPRCLLLARIIRHGVTLEKSELLRPVSAGTPDKTQCQIFVFPRGQANSRTVERSLKPRVKSVPHLVRVTRYIPKSAIPFVVRWGDANLTLPPYIMLRRSGGGFAVPGFCIFGQSHRYVTLSLETLVSSLCLFAWLLLLCFVRKMALLQAY